MGYKGCFSSLTYLTGTLEEVEVTAFGRRESGRS